MPPRSYNPRTRSNTEGRVTVRQVVPRKDFKREDFFRDLKKASRRKK